MRTGNIGIVCVFDGGVHRTFRARHFGYLIREVLHSVQFNGVVGKIFFDQTVLGVRTNQLTYFWNKPLRLAIAMMHTARPYDPLFGGKQ